MAMARQRKEGGFRILFDTMSAGIQATAFLTDNIEDELRSVVDQMVADAQENAPWSDNTGDARRGLNATIEDADDVWTVTLAHEVDYGQWLETIQSGQYAIIMPTIEAWADDIQRVIGGSLTMEGE